MDNKQELNAYLNELIKLKSNKKIIDKSKNNITFLLGILYFFFSTYLINDYKDVDVLAYQDIIIASILTLESTALSHFLIKTLDKNYYETNLDEIVTKLKQLFESNDMLSEFTEESIIRIKTKKD